MVFSNRITTRKHGNLKIVDYPRDLSNIPRSELRDTYDLILALRDRSNGYEVSHIQAQVNIRIKVTRINFISMKSLGKTDSANGTPVQGCQIVYVKVADKFPESSRYVQ